MKVTLSTRPVPSLTKEERQDIKYFTKHIKCYFEQLVHLLSKDYIYNPFPFIGMEQGMYNICGDANFVVLDVDHTSTNIHDRLLHLADEDFECILGTTSDPTNLFKYRVLLPLDRPVNAKEYRRLVTGIRTLDLIPDLDRASEKPSQKFYSYSESTVVFNKGSPLCVDDYLAPESEITQLPLDSNLALHEVLAEFQSYSTAPPGSRTRYMLSAAFKLIERGADDKLLEQVILHLNNSFLIPKDLDSVYRRVISFVKSRRKFL